MLKNIATGVFTIDAVITQAECASYIMLTERAGYEAATVITSAGAQLRPDIRNNDRVILDDHAIAASLWAKIGGDVPRIWRGRQAIGLNERFRFYRYIPGQQFRSHVDGAFRRDNGEESQLTVLVYLNDGFEGGETRFEDAQIAPKAGMALIFDHNLLHEGAPVLSGKKYVLRTDVMFAPRGQFRG